MNAEAFKNKTAIVTGAASGIGREIAKQLAAAGATVYVTDVTKGSIDAAAKEFTAAGGKAHAVLVDVSSADELQTIVDRAVTETGGIDYMFNNAGVAIFGEMENIKLEDWDKIIDVNLRGVAYGSTIAYRQMIKQGNGHIVNTASVAGLVPVALQAMYVATKHGVVGMTKTMGLESIDHGVHMTAFCPAFVKTGMFDTLTLRGELEGVDTHAIMPIKPLSAERAVERLLDGVANHRKLVIVPFYGKVGYWLERLSPSLAFCLHRFTLKETRRRAKNSRRD